MRSFAEVCASIRLPASEHFSTEGCGTGAGPTHFLTGAVYTRCVPCSHPRSPCRPELRRALVHRSAQRDRSLITNAALITNGSTEQLRAHLGIARNSGVTESKLKEVIIYLPFYAGWPRAMSAISGRERDLRRLRLDVVDQLGSRRSTKGSPGARSWMRSGFSTRSVNESGSALNGGKSGASTQPQWCNNNGVCG
jgi:carboxymuconolactone decarboxylase family protein